jgi:branched-chain amino acid transport system ATP-binding protein
MYYLQVDHIDVFYGPAQALWDVSFATERGKLVSLIGANGAGKTTTLKAITGLVPPANGNIHYDGRQISGLPVHEIADLGISLVPEGRQLFSKMTCEENLTIGSFLKRAKEKRQQKLDWVYQMFPRLAERRKQLAETLSGGEQQMLAIGRGLMQDPSLLILDEPSLGLAPVLVQEIFATVRKLHEEGLTVLLVEQNVHQALLITDYAYVLENGRIIMEGGGGELARDEKIREAYLGF